MLPIVWNARALDDLSEIIDYIAARNVAAAVDMHTRIEQAIAPIARLPHVFRPGRVPGTREIVAHPNYVVIYQVEADQIVIVSVLHTRQEYPKSD